MAVIAKLIVNTDKEFPAGVHKLDLSCVCENALMAHYSPENEDAVFTKYSPGGTCNVTVGEGRELPTKVEHEGHTAHGQVYVLFHDGEDTPSFEGCLFAIRARCGHVDDWGTSKRVFLGAAAPLWEVNRMIELPNNLIPADKIATEGAGFSYEMTIDNPAASVQFKPLGLYYVSFYDATKFNMNEVLRLARA